MNIKAGGVYWANLNPAYKSEPGKTRPVLVVQSDLLNAAGHSSTIVCPLTTNVQGGDLLRVGLVAKEAGLERPSEILIDQIRAIDNSRFVSRIGSVSEFELQSVKEAIAKVLDV